MACRTTSTSITTASAMEDDLLQLPQQLPQDDLVVSSGFFHGDGGPVSFPNSDVGFVGHVGAPAGHDDCTWMEDLIQLSDELLRDEAGTGDQQPWQCNGVSPHDPPPSMSLSLDGDRSPPSWEQGAGVVASGQRRGDEDPSAATQKRDWPPTQKRDRSKTIVSERKRRVRMKENLYELRSLVPNITKMDKASIIADAVLYVKNLQSYARKLKEEVTTLQARPGSPSRQEQEQQQLHIGGVAARRWDQGAPPADGDAAGSRGVVGARVMHVGAAQVGQGRFFVTVECERQDGVAAPLCAAVESLAGFRVESSSLRRSGPDRIVSTLTLKVNDRVWDATVGEETVKQLLMAALLKEGLPTRSYGGDLPCSALNAGI